MTACSVRGCTQTEVVRYGLCEVHYLRRRRRGLVGRVPSGQAVETISLLRELGWTFAQIADAAGIPHSTPVAIMRLRPATVRRSTHEALMRVNVGRIESSRRVDATGTLRRVQALNALGWPSRVLADRLGMQASTFTTLVHRPQVGVWFELRVQKLYVELENTPGPSKLSAARSRALRLAPPAAWDDIDDPEAKPQGVRRAA